jgi:shikimate kinase
VEPGDVLERLGDRVGSRPLLAGDSPGEAARVILERRRDDYARAEIRIDTTERPPEDVADEVLRRVAEHLRERVG